MTVAHKIFKSTFSTTHLREIFDKKISLSPAIGKDGTTKEKFIGNILEEISLISNNCLKGNYKFTCHKEKLILKGANSLPRQISIPTIRDRIALRALCDLLTAVFDEFSAKRPHFYIGQIKKAMNNPTKERVFVRIDIKNFYPSIEQDILMKIIRRKIRKKQILDLIKNAIQTPTSKGSPGNEINHKGVPQGLSISNILSNIYLMDIDKKYKKSLNYFRYVDDILIICDKNESQSILESVIKDIKKLTNLECHSHLSNNAGKTVIRDFSYGIDYLGFHLSSSGVSVRQSSYQKMYTNLMNVFTQYRYKKSIDKLLWRLNLKISGCQFDKKRFGWMFFFSLSDDIKQLKILDAFIAKQILSHGLQKISDEVKTFTKSYHEIRFNMKNTRYITKFDEFTKLQKIEAISIITGKNKAQIQGWSDSDINNQFDKSIKKEVEELENDLVRSFY